MLVVTERCHFFPSNFCIFSLPRNSFQFSTTILTINNQKTKAQSFDFPIMANKRNVISFCLCIQVATLILSSASVAIPIRVSSQPPLRSFGDPSFTAASFDRIFDTSKYGIFQLNNGLATTPQMGFVSVRCIFLILLLF